MATMSQMGRAEDQTDGLWITSDPLPDGSYALVLSVDGDHSRALTPDEAVSYGLAVFAVAAAVDYEQSVYHQLSERGAATEAVLQVVADLRRDRPPFDRKALEPLRWIPGLNSEGTGFIRLELDGHPIGQLSVDDARGHAAHVIEAVPNAENDTVYRALLCHSIGLSDLDAKIAVHLLGSYRR